MTQTLLAAALAVFAYVNLIHLLALWRRDNGIMDAAWGPGFVLVAWLGLAQGGDPDPRRWLLVALVTVWGLRLCGHILLRNAGRGEDFRYRNWRASWGRWFYVRSYAQIYLLQGFFMVVVAMPLIAVNARVGGPLGVLDALGALVWLVGFGFEAAGDYQLLRFMRNPANKGRVMREGVWRCTRHPNYFGEATLWWGCFLVALGVPGGAWALVSPVVIAWLLLRVSGIPMLEAKYAQRPDYQDYMRTTSAFFPWFPKGG
jgi:steroid 5-alpha reductase family enzyme